MVRNRNTHKVNVLASIAYLIQTSKLERYMVWCGSKNKYRKDTCLKDIGLRAQNMIAILS